MRRAPAIHPGEILADELEGLGVELSNLARQIAVPHERMAALVEGDTPMTSELALRLGHWFEVTPEFWLNLQTLHDLRLAEAAIGDEIARLPTRRAA